MPLLNGNLGNREIARILTGKKSVYFVGIGGIGMQALAILLKERGYSVGGSDRLPTSPTLEILHSMGISTEVGHTAENIKTPDLVVYTLALEETNPELHAARMRGIPCISRAELLGYLMSGYRHRIAVAGMHGKSSVTGMLAASLTAAQADPTVISGAPLSPQGSALRVGAGDILVAEACEYKDSFLCLAPSLAVALNMEWEHTDYFPTRHAVADSFSRYLSSAPVRVFPSGVSDFLDTVPQNSGQNITFGQDSTAISRAENVIFHNGCAEFDYLFDGQHIGRTRLSVMGAHNLQNALAALAAVHAVGYGGANALAGISAFHGTPRRLEYKGVWHGMSVYDDYAHHPTEISASLAALRTRTDGGRLICVFQPHTYSRTVAFYADFIRALSDADRLLLLDIYAAREQNESGVSSCALAAAISGAVYAENGEVVFSWLEKYGRAGDTLVFMGAGDIAALPAKLTYGE